MNFSGNYGADPNYVGSSLKPTRFYQDIKGVGPKTLTVLTEHEKWIGEVTNFTTHVTDEDFVQPTALWKVIKKEPGHQERFFGNVAVHLSKVKSNRLRHEAYGMCLSPNRLLEEKVGCAQANGLYSVLLSYQPRLGWGCQEGYRKPCSLLVTPDYPPHCDHKMEAKSKCFSVFFFFIIVGRISLKCTAATQQCYKELV